MLFPYIHFLFSGQVVEATSSEGKLRRLTLQWCFLTPPGGWQDVPRPERTHKHLREFWVSPSGNLPDKSIRCLNHLSWFFLIRRSLIFSYTEPGQYQEAHFSCLYLDFCSAGHGCRWGLEHWLINRKFFLLTQHFFSPQKTEATTSSLRLRPWPSNSSPAPSKHHSWTDILVTKLFWF